VTFRQYGHFARATGRQQPGNKGWGRGRRPVINVTWDDAKAFAAWLSVQTGQPYRLLSEAEWEYACRAATTTPFWWGKSVAPENAGYGPRIGRTTEVGSYPANPWGLYDTHGNVWEWVEDCRNDSYANAPQDGSAWTTGDCRRRVLRGGSWASKPVGLRSACRIWRDADDRRDSNGFRIARTLSEQPTVSSTRETHWSKLEYNDPALSGQVTFNYSNNDGQYTIGCNEYLFETRWSKASDRSIHLYRNPPTVIGVAEAPEIQSYEDIGNPASFDMSSRVQTIQEGEHAILMNQHKNYAVLKVLNIKDRTRADNVDELTFEFRIRTETA
jgi:hypothetical protein